MGIKQNMNTNINRQNKCNNDLSALDYYYALSLRYNPLATAELCCAYYYSVIITAIEKT